MGERVTLRKELGASTYKVLVDGIYVGEVWKKTTGYNLRRYLSVTSWYALTADGERVPTYGDYLTRRDAVAALVKVSEGA